MRIQTGIRRQAIALERAGRSAGLLAGTVSPGGKVLALPFIEEQGSTLVEMALTLPALLMVLTAICTFGIAFNNELTLTSAVGAGAQYLQLIRSTSSDPCADTLTAIENAAPSLAPSKISITVTMNGATPAQSNNSCAGAQSDLVQGEPVTVSATYPCALAIYGSALANTCQLSAKVTEYEY